MARLLVVDDDPGVRALLREIFEREGHDVWEAAHGAVALDVARAVEPDLVVTDVEMPVMDGRELIQRLRADASMQSVAILVISDQPRRVHGQDATCPKPFDLRALLLTTRELLRTAPRGPLAA